MRPNLLLGDPRRSNPNDTPAPPCATGRRDALEHSLNDLQRCLTDLMLPHAQDRPAFSDEGKRLAAVAVDVLTELRVPELVAGARVDVVLGAAVPEAAVDEEGELSRGNDQVGSATGGADVKPIADPCDMQSAADHELRLGMRRTDPRHVLRA